MLVSRLPSKPYRRKQAHPLFFSPFSVFYFSFSSSLFYVLLCRRSLRDKSVKDRQKKRGGGRKENRRPSVFCLLSRTHAPRPLFTRHLQFATSRGTDPVTAIYKDAQTLAHPFAFAFWWFVGVGCRLISMQRCLDGEEGRGSRPTTDLRILGKVGFRGSPVGNLIPLFLDFSLECVPVSLFLSFRGLKLGLTN